MKNFYRLALPFMGALLFTTQNIESQVYKISDGLLFPGGVSNNSIVSAKGGSSLYKWDLANGLVNIGTIADGSGVTGQVTISTDGTKISGTATNPAKSVNEASLYDVQTGIWTNLGGISTAISGNESSSSWGISSDGTAVVGLGWVSVGEAHAVKWSAASGMTDLGGNFPGNSFRANGISADKNTIVGWQDIADGSRAGSKWVNGVQTLITTPTGENVGEATAVSADGKVITGIFQIAGYVSTESGLQFITHPDMGFNFRGGATAVSGDGKKVVGYFRDFPGPPMTGEGFIWTEDTGRINLNDYVTGLGMSVNDIKFGLPLAISADGLKIAGTGTKISNGGTVAFLIDLTTALATKNSNKEQVTISPNPVKDMITITGAKTRSAEIISMTGQKIRTVKVSDQKADVSFLSKGIYFLQIISNGQKQNIKLIKE